MDDAIDLRSDAVTQPTDAMWDAMRSARIGWAAAGDDPHVRELEHEVATLLGKPAGVMVHGGGAANLLALLGQCERGEQVIVDDLAHILWAEEWGFAYVGAVVHRALASERGRIAPAVLDAAIRAASFRHRPRTALVCVENSHNAWGGAVVPPEHLAGLAAVARAHGARVHVDGARLLNAAAALGLPAAALVADADTVSFNLNKGLSAPYGAVLCGDEALVERTRVTMKRLGMGTPHQAGLFAVAGLVGLRTMQPRHAEDNRLARLLGERLAGRAGQWFAPWPVETNIVFVSPTVAGLDASGLQAALASRGVRVSVASDDTIRMVTHRHVTEAGLDRTVAAFVQVGLEREPR